MEGTVAHFLPLFAFTFLIALVYSSVGHGGASGYLALLSFLSFPHEIMSTSALCLNLLVAGTAFWFFLRASHFSWGLTWPFTVASVPFAFIGGLLRIPAAFYSLLLAFVLIFAAVRLIFDSTGEQHTFKFPSLKISLPLGGAIGILSGMVGVGGGIFLSPILLIFHWADPKKTAATSACFILVNSLAGLFGRLARNSFQVTPLLLTMVVTAFLGGVIGSRLGANHFSGRWLKRVLAGVLLIATFKLLTPFF